MTDKQDEQSGDYEVGYGRPPKHARFKKGHAGNPKGRPKKKGAVPVDVEAILNAPVSIIQDGKARKISPKEVELRRVLKKAMGGDLRSIIYLLDQFEKYGALERPKPKAGGGVLMVPKTMPLAMGWIIFKCFGHPPWTKRQKAFGRKKYLATLSKEDRKIDESRDYYEDLREP